MDRIYDEGVTLSLLLRFRTCVFLLLGSTRGDYSRTKPATNFNSNLKLNYLNNLFFLISQHQSSFLTKNDNYKAEEFRSTDTYNKFRKKKKNVKIFKPYSIISSFWYSANQITYNSSVNVTSLRHVIKENYSLVKVEKEIHYRSSPYRHVDRSYVNQV